MIKRCGENLKNRRFQYEYRRSASKLHKAVGDVLRNSSLFNGYGLYQEYPVTRVNPSYESTAEHFDWVIPEIKLVIEAHGRQHYEVTDFSGKQEDGGLGAYKSQRKRDEAKKEAALLAGYTYIVIPYTDEKIISEDYIWNLYKANENKDLPSPQVEISKGLDKLKPYYNKEARAEYLESDKHQQALARAREYRKEQYQRAKELKKKWTP